MATPIRVDNRTRPAASSVVTAPSADVAVPPEGAIRRTGIAHRSGAAEGAFPIVAVENLLLAGQREVGHARHVNDHYSRV